MQWVNAGFLGSNGWGSDADYLDAGAARSPRRPVGGATPALAPESFELFRDPDYATEQPDDAPQMYGDGVAIPAGVGRTSG